MLFKSMLVSALVATSSAAVIARTGGGDSPSTPTNPTPESCTTRDDGNTSPKYCPNLGGIGVVIPVQLCSLVLDVTAGLNVLSCCGASSCVAIDIL